MKSAEESDLVYYNGKSSIILETGRKTNRAGNKWTERAIVKNTLYL